jgi:transglutaminase-like putative cysteine protease
MFGNYVAIARFAERASELRVESTIRVDQAPSGFRAADITEFARTYPFAYPAEDRPDHAHFTAPPLAHPRLDRWAASFLRADGSADTRELFVGMTQTMRRTFKHVARHEKGTLDPMQTLKVTSGSCRDLAMLMIAALRSLGIAARFVSGYLHLADDEDNRLTGGSTMLGFRPTFPVRAGSTSIRRAVWSGTRTSCASLSHGSRKKRFHRKARGLEPRQTILS